MILIFNLFLLNFEDFNGFFIEKYNMLISLKNILKVINWDINEFWFSNVETGCTFYTKTVQKVEASF